MPATIARTMNTVAVNADRYADNAGDKAGNCLGPTGVASRLRVDLVLDPAADDDPGRYPRAHQ